MNEPKRLVRPLMLLLPGLLLIGGVFLLASRSSATPPPSAPAAALTVSVATANQTPWPVTLEASGAIAPWQEAIIGAEEAGLRLIDVRVNVGDVVKRGEILAVFDSERLRADEARLKASWQQAEANRQRAERLKGSGSISDQDVLDYVTQADVAKAQLQSTQLQLRHATVRAPDDGIISARSATLGAVASSGQELFRMIRQRRLEWRGELTAAQLAQIRPAQHVTLALPDGSTADARVRQTAPSLDTQTRLGLVYADLAAGSSARAGMYAKGKIALAEAPAITVPALSVVVRDGRSYVPKLLAGDRVALQPVQVGRRQGDAAEILSGIQVGDRVAVEGAAFLNDGDLVRIAPALPRE